MSRCDDEWRGLWHPRPADRPRDELRSSADQDGKARVKPELIVRAVVYFVTPLALAVVFGHFGSIEELGRGYLGSFIVGTSIAGSFDLLYRFVWPRLVRTRPRWSLRIAGHLVTLVVAVGAGVVIAEAFGSALLGWTDESLWQLFVRGAVISSVIITILVTADETTARARAAERRAAILRVAAVRAELAALQARTDPHFLFNSLNTVAALIPEDPALAETLLVRLAAVFRYALDAGRRGSVALAEEIAAVTAYLEVEALRIGPRLRWRLDRDTGLDAVRVPPLVLQPLVENAIRHGAGTRRGATEIVVTARRRDGELVLSVEDQGAAGDRAEGGAAAGGAGTALADLRDRLALAYPDRARLAAGAAPPAGWRAEVVMPVEQPA